MSLGPMADKMFMIGTTMRMLIGLYDHRTTIVPNSISSPSHWVALHAMVLLTMEWAQAIKVAGQTVALVEAATG